MTQSVPSPVKALTIRAFSLLRPVISFIRDPIFLFSVNPVFPAVSAVAARFSSAVIACLLSAGRYGMFTIGMTGMPLRTSFPYHSFSTASQSRKIISAISVFSKALAVSPILLSPSSAASSSNPAVSVKRHGPMPGISIALCTGSVVVPGVSDTSATFWPVIALTSEDFPAFRFPKTVM